MTLMMPRHLFTVDDFYRMAEAGILRPEDRVELIEGEIVEMAPTGSRHAYVVDNLTRLFTRGIDPQEAIVRIQGPVRLNERTELLPDLAVLAGKSYVDRLPGPNDVLLVVEVADATLLSDRRVKLPLYASAGVREAWIVDLTSSCIEVHRDLMSSDYSTRTVARRGERVSPVALPSLVLAVDDVLGQIGLNT